MCAYFYFISLLISIFNNLLFSTLRSLMLLIFRLLLTLWPNLTILFTRYYMWPPSSSSLSAWGPPPQNKFLKTNPSLHHTASMYTYLMFSPSFLSLLFCSFAFVCACSCLCQLFGFLYFHTPEPPTLHRYDRFLILFVLVGVYLCLCFTVWFPSFFPTCLCLAYLNLSAMIFSVSSSLLRHVSVDMRTLQSCIIFMHHF